MGWGSPRTLLGLFGSSRGSLGPFSSWRRLEHGSQSGEAGQVLSLQRSTSLLKPPAARPQRSRTLRVIHLSRLPRRCPPALLLPVCAQLSGAKEGLRDTSRGGTGPGSPRHGRSACSSQKRSEAGPTSQRESRGQEHNPWGSGGLVPISAPPLMPGQLTNLAVPRFLNLRNGFEKKTPS